MREFDEREQHDDMERFRHSVSDILDKLDMGERLNSGERLLLRWWAGIPMLPPPKDYAQMPLGWDGNGSPAE